MSVKTHRALCALPVLLALLPAEAWAERNLVMSDALARALLESPKLERYSHAVRAAEAERVQAVVRPNPTVRVELENLGGSGELSGTRALESTLMLSQLLELGGKRQRRAAAAAHNIGLVEADYQVARLDVLAEVARRFVHADRDQRLLQVARSAVGLAEQTRNAVARRVEAAQTQRAVLRRAEIELARAEIALEHREHELRAARRRLAASWGSDTVDFDTVQADLLTLPPTRDLEPLLAELKRSPHLRRFVSERRLREAQLALAQARAVPDARVGLGLRRLESVDEQALALEFSMDLPLFDRNRGNVRSARERLERVTVEERARYLELQALLFQSYQELLHARTQRDALHDLVIPEAEQVLLELETGYRQGRFSYLELFDARRELVALRIELIDAAASYHLQLIEMERLTGLGLAPNQEDSP